MSRWLGFWSNTFTWSTASSHYRTVDFALVNVAFSKESDFAFARGQSHFRADFSWWPLQANLIVLPATGPLIFPKIVPTCILVFFWGGEDPTVMSANHISTTLSWKNCMKHMLSMVQKKTGCRGLTPCSIHTHISVRFSSVPWKGEQCILNLLVPSNALVHPAQDSKDVVATIPWNPSKIALCSCELIFKYC